jgi:hypothetical protein
MTFAHYPEFSYWDFLLECQCSSCSAALLETVLNDDCGRYEAELAQASALPLPDDDDEAFES